MSSPAAAVLSEDEARRLLTRGIRLEYATLAWNALEIGVLGWAAIMSRSVALAGFAIDSGIEIFASIVVLWELGGSHHPERERRALRLIGVAFFGLALFIAAQSIATLAAGVRPEESRTGIAWLSLTCVAMFSLGFLKRRTGAQLGSSVLRAEAGVTFIDGALAAGILVGLIMNAVAGWWWADLAGGVIIIVYGVREGMTHLRGDAQVDDDVSAQPIAEVSRDQ